MTSIKQSNFVKNCYITLWLDKINENCNKFIKSGSWNTGKMYGMVETHKVDNIVCVITGGYNISFETPSISVEKTLYQRFLWVCQNVFLHTFLKKNPRGNI